MTANEINEESNDKQFLSNRIWHYLDDNQIKLINDKVNSIFKDINKNQLSILQKSIDKCKLESVYRKFEPKNQIYKIGTLNSLDYLIEALYQSQKSNIKKMFADKAKLEPYIYKFRHLSSDGDSFYKCLIFCFFENIVITNNIMLLKEILVLFEEKINEKNHLIKKKEFLKQIEELNIGIVTQGLYILITSLENENIYKTYLLFLKIFLFCPDFLKAIIYFTKYLLYEYISLNQNKIYSKEKPIEIGNLLPEDFIYNKGGKNKYFFENFYLQLMKPNSPAANIVRYVAPFVFNCNINTLIYYCGENSFVEEKKYMNEKKAEFQINLLFNNAQYHIYYNKDFYHKYYNYLDSLINIQENLCYLNDKNLYEYNNDVLKKKINEIQSELENANNTIINLNKKIKELESEKEKFQTILKEDNQKIIDLKSIIEKQNQIILNIKNGENTIQNIDNHNDIISTLKNELLQKDKEIINLKAKFNNDYNMIHIDRNNMISLNFISVDQKINYSIPCLNNDIFAKIEEILYKKYPDYRETNNCLISNGKQILRFKTIKENNLKSGVTILLEKPDN